MDLFQELLEIFLAHWGTSDYYLRRIMMALAIFPAVACLIFLFFGSTTAMFVIAFIPALTLVAIYFWQPTLMVLGMRELVHIRSLLMRVAGVEMAAAIFLGFIPWADKRVLLGIFAVIIAMAFLRTSGVKKEVKTKEVVSVKHH